MVSENAALFGFYMDILFCVCLLHNSGLAVKPRSWFAISVSQMQGSPSEYSLALQTTAESSEISLARTHHQKIEITKTSMKICN